MVKNHLKTIIEKRSKTKENYNSRDIKRQRPADTIEGILKKHDINDNQTILCH